MTKSSKPSQMVEKLVNKGVRGISNADGLLSIGWSVDGLSVIERISGTDVPTAGVDKKASGHGVPAYGAAGFSADSFAIDGTDLIPCAQVQTPSNTPSCSVPVAAGKTGYAARVENYERIRQDPTSNTWTVTAKNGTSSLYIALDGGTAVSTFRWHLASVTDTRGNHIDYTWTCDAAFQCDISTIAYKNQGSSTAVSTITFYKETRPDPITYHCRRYNA